MWGRLVGHFLSGRSPPILATSLTRQSLRLCRSTIQILDSLTAGHRSVTLHSITGTGSAIFGRSLSASFQIPRGRLPLLKSIDVRFLHGEPLITMHSSSGTNTPKLPYLTVRRLTGQRISPDTICSCRHITDSHN